MTEDPTRAEPGSEKSVRRQPRDEITGAALDPSQPLIWRRSVPFAPEFELRQGSTVIGEMEPAGSVEMDATGECLGRFLELRLEHGILRGVRVLSRVSMTEEAGPGFRGRFFGWGRVTTGAGEALRWRNRLWRVYDHGLFDAEGELLLRLKPTFLRFSRMEKTRVIPSARGWARGDLGELLLLTWFLRAHAEARGRKIFRKSRGLFRCRSR